MQTLLTQTMQRHLCEIFAQAKLTPKGALHSPLIIWVGESAHQTCLELGMNDTHTIQHAVFSQAHLFEVTFESEIVHIHVNVQTGRWNRTISLVDIKSAPLTSDISHEHPST